MNKNHLAHIFDQNGRFISYVLKTTSGLLLFAALAATKLGKLGIPIALSAWMIAAILDGYRSRLIKRRQKYRSVAQLAEHQTLNL